MIRLEIPILFLEYYARSSAIGCGKCNNLEAKRFTYETNWYISTIAGDFRSNVHGLFIAIDGVGGFTNGHNNFGLTKGVGNGACIVIPFYFCADSFTKSAEWYESTILSNVWSSIFNGYNFVVNNEIVGTNGHNNTGVNRDILCTNSIFQSLSICSTLIIAYNNNNIQNSFLISIDFQNRFALCYSSSAAGSRGQLNLSISVGAVFNVSIHSCTSINNLTAAIYNGNIYGIGLANFTLFTVKCESVIRNRVNNSQSFYN